MSAKNSRDRIAHLRSVAEFGEKARNLREVMDVFVDEVETQVLRDLEDASTAEELLQVQMYYKAVVDFNRFLQAHIAAGNAKEVSLRNMIEKEKKEKGD